MYNPALGKFLSVDPLFKSYPWYTPYQFAGNMPIWAIDLDGLEEEIKISHYECKELNGDLVIKLEMSVHVHYKILNLTSYVLTSSDKKLLSSTLSIKTAKFFSGTISTQRLQNKAMLDPEGNTYLTEQGVKLEGSVTITTSYEYISSLDEINDDDYVLLLVNDYYNDDAAGMTNMQGGNIASAILIPPKGGGGFETDPKALNTLAGVLAHEEGHTFGLGDLYRKGNPNSDKVMGISQYTRNPTVSDGEFAEIIYHFLINHANKLRDKRENIRQVYPTKEKTIEFINDEVKD